MEPQTDKDDPLIEVKLQKVFDEIAAAIRNTSSDNVVISNEIKLEMYGLYKFISNGPCEDGTDNNMPSRIQVVARAKYQAWVDCSKQYTSLPQAQLAYLKLVASIDSAVGRMCKEKLHSLTSNCQNEGKQTLVVQDGKDTENHKSETPTLLSTDNNSAPFHQSLLWIHRLLRKIGVHPIIPRGQLDISYPDLVFAAFWCLWQTSDSMSRIALLKTEIADYWNSKSQGKDESKTENIVVGQSVRSLLDLYLTSRSYQPESEVIIVPPINIPGMMDILSVHKLRIVPVEGSHQPLQVDLESVKKAVTKQTVAILVVHPFGMISTTETQMQTLQSWCAGQNIDILEDCAECYSGFGPQSYLGSDFATVSLFSFGTIKTATALGGGIAMVHSAKTAEKMKQLQYAVYKQQTHTEYLCKIIKAFIIKVVASYPLLFGIFVACCKGFGIDYNGVIVGVTRNFSTKQGHGQENASDSSPRRRELISQIRKRPCPALLSLLQRRLKGHDVTETMVKARMDQCHKMRQLMETKVDDDDATTVVPTAPTTTRHLYWLFPILVDSPDACSRHLECMGYDVPRGASQLVCVSEYCKNDASPCRQTKNMFDKILYLPVASRPMSVSEMEQLVYALQFAIKASQEQVVETSTVKCQSRDNDDKKSQVRRRLAICIAAVLVDVCLLGGFVLRVVPLSIFSIVVAAHMLRYFIADFYIESSQSFAKYNTLLNRQHNEQSRIETENNKAQQSPSLFEQDSLRLPKQLVVGENSVNDRSVLLTGATGFVGSMLLRDLLFHRDSLLIGGGVVVLCRAKNGKSAKSRIHKLLDGSMFSFLSEQQKRDLVTVVEGDVTLDNLGLSTNDLDLVCNKKRISHVIHCAAAVSFTQSIEEAAISNISSALNVQSLCTKLGKGVRFVYISTAFCHGAKTGSDAEPLSEGLFSLHPYDPWQVYQSMLNTQSYACSAMNELGFPNTYTFSKCVCENLLVSDKSIDTIIIRPSIVGPAVRYPYEGWAGTKPSTIVAAACLYLSYQWNLWSFGQQDVPFVPVDVVSRFIIAKSFGSGKRDTRIQNNSSPASSESDSFERVSQWEELSSFGSKTNEDTLSSSDDDTDCVNIYNAAWDVASSENASFTWVDYAVAVTQLGSIEGFFSKATAYIGLLVTVKVLPRLKMTRTSYATLHNTVVQRPIQLLLSTFDWIGWEPTLIQNLKKLQPFLDLPLLFFPFMNSTFKFKSSLKAPEDFDGERYMFTCAIAATDFVSRMMKRQSQKDHRSLLVVGGRHHVSSTNDMWWALSQPRGNYFIRVAGFFMTKIIRAIASEVTVDAASFSHAVLARESLSKTSSEGPCHLILAPTHRSLFDFLILGYVFFAFPELGVPLPNIAAAEDFAKLNLLGWFARKAGAFFLKRGRGYIDPELTRSLKDLKDKEAPNGACLEVFLEGSRSRDRRFLPPKTGFIRCLVETGGNHIVVPITISYERIPEQATMVSEAERGARQALRSQGLFRWLWEALSGKVHIGRVHVAAGMPLDLLSSPDEDYFRIGAQIQDAQQEQCFVSWYHINSAARLLGLGKEVVRKALASVGCRFWPNKGASVGDCLETSGVLKIPVDRSELWTIVLHFGCRLAPFFARSHPQWCRWLNPSQFASLDASSFHDFLNLNGKDELRSLVTSLSCCFEAADVAIDSAIQLLMSKGFETPNAEHILQVARDNNARISPYLLRQAIFLRSELEESSVGSVQVGGDRGTAHSEASCNGGRMDTLGAWGYDDTAFVLQLSNDGKKSVILKGNKYGICGKRLNKLVPFIEKETQTYIDPLNVAHSSASLASETASTALKPSDIDVLQQTVSHVSTSMQDRVRNGFGHSQEDVFALRNGTFADIRIADAVVWPVSEKEVSQIVSIAKENKWCLIPCGGGTNVTRATLCPSKDVDPRPIISVDTRKMNHILWIKEEDGLAHVQSGITGKQLADELKERGYTVGHEPDSAEFSTLGGWIATKASGMKRNKYGNIEDIVVAVRVAGSNGMLWQGNGCTAAYGRESRGMDLASVVMGSEGCFGLITSAIVRIWPLPERREYASAVFPDFEHGLRFVRDVAKLGPNIPASVRLLDNEHFRLGMALKEDMSLFASFKLTTLKLLRPGFATESVVCATVVFEGSQSEVQEQTKVIRGLAAIHGGVLAGSSTGRDAYDLTFVIAYLRDFALSYNYLSESFETFAPWSQVQSIITATKKRVEQEHQKRCLPGRPFMGCRVTQLYHEGACLYFYLCFNIENIANASRVFAEIEHAARDTILKQGGSLSHHHGVGKLRSSFLSRMDSSPMRELRKSVKKAIDPDNIFGARNSHYASISLPASSDGN